HPAGPEAEMAAATSLSSAGAWPLRRYGRFVRPDPPHGHAATVLESNEESGHLILTIVVSGHFFISQGRTVLEGFSLISAHTWLKIVRRTDCLLFGSKSKNECRMFRVQFDGDSKEQAVEHCCNCVQKLAEYVTVQVTDEQSQELQGQSQFLDSENQVQQNASIPPGVSGSVLNSKSELPHVYQHCVWSAKDLGPFIRLCLMDQNFPAFVEEVEKELKKLTEG
uniref:REC114 meiotic recombination protein n=1 Tax=Crocodylus porosus TaxID=8502 RepID=A0A7M4EFB2_CROPO